MGAEVAGVASLRTDAQDTSSGNNAGNTRPVRIWSVGGTGAGTGYFGRDNMIGLYNYTKDVISQGNAPDLWIWHGEGLPRIPRFITKGDLPDQLLLADHAQTLDETVVAVKPYVSRIMEVIKQAELDTQVVYVMGRADRRNKDRQFERLTLNYEKSPKYMLTVRAEHRGAVEKLEEDVASVELTNKKKREELAILEKKLEAGQKHSEPGAKLEEMRHAVENQKRRISKNDEKASEIRDELEDYRRLLGLYTELFKLWVKNHDDSVEKLEDRFGDLFDAELYESCLSVRGGKTLQERRERAKEDIAALRKVIAGLDSSDPAQAKRLGRLETLIKGIANVNTRYAHEGMDSAVAEAEKENEKRIEAALNFTHNAPGDSRLAKLANRIAWDTITLKIKDVYGRRHNLTIVATNMEMITVKGVNVCMANSATNTSDTIARSNKNLGRLQAMSRAEKPDIVNGAWSAYGRYSMRPRENGSPDIVHELVTPMFIDIVAARRAWNEGLKTPTTEMVGKYRASSGFDELIYDPKTGHVVQVFNTSEYMEMKAAKEKARQALTLAKSIRDLRPWKPPKRYALTDRDRLEVTSKLPTEMRDSERMTKLLMHMGVDPADRKLRKALADKIVKMDFQSDDPRLSRPLQFFAGYVGSSVTPTQTADQMGVLTIADWHVGNTGMGTPQVDLLKAVTVYVRENLAGRGPFSIAVLGDNTEGSHKEILNEVNKENAPSNIYEFQRELERKGIMSYSPQHEALVNEYRATLQKKAPVVNFEEQNSIFAEEFAPLAKIAIESGGSIWILSGNHKNKSQKDRKSTEAGSLIEAVRARLPENMRDSVINADTGGGDWGWGIVRVGEKGMPVRLSHKGNATQLAERLASPEVAQFKADQHKHEVEIIGNHLFATGMQGQGETPYTGQINIPVGESLRGASFVQIRFNGQTGDPYQFSSEAITLRELKAVGILRENQVIRDFEFGLRRPTVPMERQTVKI